MPKSLFPLLLRTIVKNFFFQLFSQRRGESSTPVAHNVERLRPIIERGKIIKWLVHRRLINPYAVGIWNLLNATLIMQNSLLSRLFFARTFIIWILLKNFYDNFRNFAWQSDVVEVLKVVGCKMFFIKLLKRRRIHESLPTALELSPYFKIFNS